MNWCHGLTESSVLTSISFSFPNSGYLAPEYVMGRQLTSKADVYSFGVLILEIVSGRSSGSGTWQGQKLLLESVGIIFKFLKFLSRYAFCFSVASIVYCMVYLLAFSTSIFIYCLSLFKIRKLLGMSTCDSIDNMGESIDDKYISMGKFNLLQYQTNLDVY